MQDTLDIPTTASRIYEEYEKEAELQPPRPHLGASEIGKECERALWYGFRWVSRIKFEGRMLRLFSTGQLEEQRIINDLQKIGVQIEAFDFKTGRQFNFKMFGGHFGGSMDGRAIGFIEAPHTWHVVEFKTHSEKSFGTKDSIEKKLKTINLIKDGVEKAKPEHYAQMQSYMGMSHEVGYTGDALDRAMYLAVCKNDDRIYCERIKFDKKFYQQIKDKAQRVIFSALPLPKISSDPEFFKCKFCNFNKLCHAKTTGERVVPDLNCRTCLHSTPMENGNWKCEKYNKLLTVGDQVKGCTSHLFIPQLLPLEQINATDNEVTYRDSEGNTVVNMEGGSIFIRN